MFAPAPAPDMSDKIRKLPKECIYLIMSYSYNVQPHDLCKEIVFRNKSNMLFNIFLNRAMIFTVRAIVYSKEIFAFMYDYLVLYTYNHNIKIQQHFIMECDYDAYKKYAIVIWRKLDFASIEHFFTTFDEFLLMCWYFSNTNPPPELFTWMYEDGVILPKYQSMINRFQNVNNVVNGVQNIL
jgi:hypothetical protein